MGDDIVCIVKTSLILDHLYITTDTSTILLICDLKKKQFEPVVPEITTTNHNLYQTNLHVHKFDYFVNI